LLFFPTRIISRRREPIEPTGVPVDWRGVVLLMLDVGMQRTVYVVQRPYRCSDSVVSMGTVFSPRFPARNHVLSYTALSVALPRRPARPEQGSNDLRTHGDDDADDDDILSRSPFGRLVGLSRRPALSAVSLRCRVVYAMCTDGSSRALQIARVVHRLFSFIVRGIDRQFH